MWERIIIMKRTNYITVKRKHKLEETRVIQRRKENSNSRQGKNIFICKTFNLYRLEDFETLNKVNFCV